MYIRAVKLIVNTDKGPFGFFVPFSPGLTIVKGKNSSGKSTFINTLLYSLGMEELVGGKGEKVLPYAVKDYLDFNDQKISVNSSAVYLELENSKAEVITLRRSIKDDNKSSKLVEAFNGGSLTGNIEFSVNNSLYIHDSGSAQSEDGFFSYLEKFLDLDLPKVSTTSGGVAKLYLQTIFAALAVEQKRGWSDYIAGIPFYGIREARLRVVEFLLNLNVFEINALKNNLDADSVEISAGWITNLNGLKMVADDLGVVLSGIPAKVLSSFSGDDVYLAKLVGEEQINFAEYIENLRCEYASLDENVKSVAKVSDDQISLSFDTALSDLQKYTNLYELKSSQQAIHSASLNEYKSLLVELNEDLVKNKAALKLRNLGAIYSISSASDTCPTCHQRVEDSIVSEIVTGPQMELEDSVTYLERQSKMLEAQIKGIEFELDKNDGIKLELSKIITSKRDFLNAVRTDVANGAVESRANIKRQLQIEDEINKLERFEDSLNSSLGIFQSLSERLFRNQQERKKLPKSTYSNEDLEKISHFEKHFRMNVSAFGYESAPVKEIEINRDTLTPFLSSIELRELNASKSDISTDSSASDFVRLIWSYLLALHQTSAFHSVHGNHPGLLILDEPGQHSMAVSSQHALLRELGSDSKLQSIIAASFDENDAVFKEATDNVTYSLVELDSKSIRPFH